MREPWLRWGRSAKDDGKQMWDAFKSMEAAIGRQYSGDMTAHFTLLALKRLSIDDVMRDLADFRVGGRKRDVINVQR